MPSANHERSLGTLMAIARTRVAADEKLGVITPPGIRALAAIENESTVVITSEAFPSGTVEEGIIEVTGDVCGRPSNG